MEEDPGWRGLRKRTGKGETNFDGQGWATREFGDQVVVVQGGTIGEPGAFGDTPAQDVGGT